MPNIKPISELELMVELEKENALQEEKDVYQRMK